MSTYTLLPVCLVRKRMGPVSMGTWSHCTAYLSKTLLRKLPVEYLKDSECILCEHLSATYSHSLAPEISTGQGAIICLFPPDDNPYRTPFHAMPLVPLFWTL